MKNLLLTLALALLCAESFPLPLRSRLRLTTASQFPTALSSGNPHNQNNNDMELNLTQEWDKTFPQSDKVSHEKVTFKNRYGITLVADLYIPTEAAGATKNAEGRLAAIAVSGPFGAVKEQCSGLYAQTLAERGFLTLAFDPSFTGESSGEPRYVASPDINTEDFQAAVDYLISRQDVDAERVGILGICGWGGIALNAAAIDTRVRATVAVTMYDMSRVNHNGYFDATTDDELHALKQQLNAQRNKDFAAGTYDLGGGVIDPLPADAPQFVKDYHAYYKTPRGYHERSLNSNGGWNVTSSLSWINAGFLARTREIRSAVLVIHGADAHSCYFSRDAFAQMTSGDGEKWAANKQLLIIPNASHTDLYDGGAHRDKIPFDRIAGFFRENMK